MNKLLYLPLLLSLLFSYSANADTSKIALGAADWCPYTCNDKKEPGFIAEYIKAIFKKIKLEPAIKVLPWSQAMAMAKEGRLNGLITASSEEAKGLIQTNHSTTNYQMCFYTSVNSKWKYDGIQSVKKIKLGVIRNYSYGEPVDSYIKEPNPNILSLSGKNPLQRQNKMLVVGQIDAFIEDKYVAQYELGKNLRNAGCLKPNYLYMAFNKKTDPKIIKKIDNELGKPQNKKLLEKIINRYISKLKKHD